MSLIYQFCVEIDNTGLDGDILEFGTGSGGSAEAIASLLPDKKIITFDGFSGLPKTNKVIPENTDWQEGNLHFPYEDTKKRLENFINVTIHKTMSWELKNPKDYNIDKICAANMDFDLYEGTLDALNFISKCTWNEIFLRFDDWGAYDFQKKSEVDQHEKAAFFDWINDTKYDYFEYTDLLNSVGGLQTIIKVTRK